MSALDQLQPWLAPYAKWLVALGGAQVQVTSTYRSMAQQTELYRRYRAGQSKYPAAPPGASYHNYGRAFDIVGPPNVLAYLGAVWEQMGGTWGGRYGSPDPIHFQA